MLLCTPDGRFTAQLHCPIALWLKVVRTVNDPGGKLQIYPIISWPLLVTR